VGTARAGGEQDSQSGERHDRGPDAAGPGAATDRGHPGHGGLRRPFLVVDSAGKSEVHDPLSPVKRDWQAVLADW
jgi:hypothetical protein